MSFSQSENSFSKSVACYKLHLLSESLFENMFTRNVNIFGYLGNEKKGLEIKWKKYLIKVIWFYATLKILFDLDLCEGTKGITEDVLFLTIREKKKPYRIWVGKWVFFYLICISLSFFSWQLFCFFSIFDDRVKPEILLENSFVSSRNL